MKRFRIDFSIRELDVPEDQAEGVRFGDEVPLTQMFQFFDRCRDAMRALYEPEIRAREGRVSADEIHFMEELDNILSKKTMREWMSQTHQQKQSYNQPRQPFPQPQAPDAPIGISKDSTLYEDYQRLLGVVTSKKF